MTFGTGVLFIGEGRELNRLLFRSYHLKDVVLSENGDGEIDSKLDEWVEVYNPGPGDVHLTEYWLRDGLGEAVHLNLFGGSYRQGVCRIGNRLFGL